MIMASNLFDRMLLDWETDADACGVCEEKRVEGIFVYECTLLFIQRKGTEVVWSMEVNFLVNLTLELILKTAN